MNYIMSSASKYKRNKQFRMHISSAGVVEDVDNCYTVTMKTKAHLPSTTIIKPAKTCLKISSKEILAPLGVFFTILKCCFTAHNKEDKSPIHGKLKNP